MQASDFAARFVRLSKADRECEVLQDLKDMIMGIGSVGFEISPQEETALRLKPNKMFKRVRLCLFLSYPDGVSLESSWSSHTISVF